jgi:hypothetical protein
MGAQIRFLASAEGDDAADRVVGRDAHCHAIAGHYLDAEAAHSSAQLRQNFVSLVTLDTVKASAVHSHDGALHVNQIILAQ